MNKFVFSASIHKHFSFQRHDKQARLGLGLGPDESTKTLLNIWRELTRVCGEGIKTQLQLGTGRICRIHVAKWNSFKRFRLGLCKLQNEILKEAKNVQKCHF